MLRPADIFKPNGVNILLQIESSPGVQGGLHLPQKMTSLEFVTAKVLAKGPDCKVAKVGQRFIVALKAIINGEKGIVIEGVRLFFTQENLVVCFIEEPEAGDAAPALTPTAPGS